MEGGGGAAGHGVGGAMEMRGRCGNVEVSLLLLCCLRLVGRVYPTCILSRSLRQRQSRVGGRWVGGEARTARAKRKRQRRRHHVIHYV